MQESWRFNVRLKASSAEIKRLSRNCSSERGFGSKLGLTNGVEAIGISWTQTKVIARLMVSLWAKKWFF